MNYAVIAAGEGFRLFKEGITVPKPMVRLHGEMLIDRLIGIFRSHGITSLTIIINEQSPALRDHLEQLSTDFPLDIIVRSTPSSFHSFYELVKTLPYQDEVCVTTTDTVFREEEFAGLIRAFESDEEADGYMAVTSFVDDESPLFVGVTGESQWITSFDDKNDGHRFVSGGIYCLRRPAFALAEKAMASGISRMRNFQRLLIAEGKHLRAYPFSKIVDVDHIADIKTAESFLTETV